MLALEGQVEMRPSYRLKSARVPYLWYWPDDLELPAKIEDSVVPYEYIHGKDTTTVRAMTFWQEEHDELIHHWPDLCLFGVHKMYNERWVEPPPTDEYQIPTFQGLVRVGHEHVKCVASMFTVLYKNFPLSIYGLRLLLKPEQILSLKEN